MIIQCPKCEKKYKVNDDVVPAGGAAVECPNCGNIFTIYKEISDIQLIPYVEETASASNIFESKHEIPVAREESQSSGINKSGEFPEMGTPLTESASSETREKEVMTGETEQADKIASDFEKLLDTGNAPVEEKSASTNEQVATPHEQDAPVSNKKVAALWEKFKTLSGQQNTNTETETKQPSTEEKSPIEEPIPEVVDTTSSEIQDTSFVEDIESVSVAEPQADERQAAEKEKAKKLARALAKDIKLYHGDKVKQGLENGNLVELIGSEIKKSWKFYQQKVSPEILQQTTYFEDALNEILANGEKLFKFN